MRVTCVLAALILLACVPVLPVAAQPVAPMTHDTLHRALDDIAGHLHEMGEWWRACVAPGARWTERPLISVMLEHRTDLALSPAQAEALEQLRGDFQREVIRRDADLRIAEMDLAASLKGETVDLARVEAKVREIERVRADLRFARIRAIEEGRAQLTPEQRERLRSLLAAPRSPISRPGQR